MESQGNSDKKEDQGNGRGSKDDENKPKICPYCSGTCHGTDCSQFPSLQFGVRQARVPRRHSTATIPELNESSVGASSSSDGTEHPSVNQVEGAEQASSVPSVPEKFVLYTPPVEEEVEYTPEELKEMEHYVGDELMRIIEAKSNLEEPSSSSHGTARPTVNQVKVKAGASSLRTSSLRASSLPYVPIEKRYSLPSAIQDAANVLVSAEEFEHCLYNAVQAEIGWWFPVYTIPVGASSTSHGTMHPSYNQVEAAQAASPLPSKHPSFNQVEAAQAASPLPSEHPSFNQVEAAQAASPVPAIKLYYGPGSPVKKDKVDLSYLNSLLEETFRMRSPATNMSSGKASSSSQGTGYYSPHKPPLLKSAGRAAVQASSSSRGAGHPPSQPAFRPSSFRVAETSLSTNPHTTLPSSDWTPQDDGIDVVLPCGSTQNMPKYTEALRRMFDDVLSLPSSRR